METKQMTTIQNSDGSIKEVELVTFLISDDQTKSYLVYSQGEKVGADDDEVIYISRIENEGDIIKLSEISDDVEWADVQKLLKKIANA